MSFILGENKYFLDDLDLSDEEFLLEYLFRREWWKRENLKFETPEQDQKEIFKYIELYYNVKRMHSSLNFLSPLQYEKQNS